jgi:DNA-directed RNA polymerase alpha subunit
LETTLKKELHPDDIENLKLGARIDRFLWLAHITKISQLVDKSEGDLLHTNNLGKVFVKQIKTTLNEHGYKLRGQQ